jgi:hypothetical protein
VWTAAVHIKARGRAGWLGVSRVSRQRRGRAEFVGRRSGRRWSAMAGANSQVRVSAGSVVDQRIQGRAKAIEKSSKGAAAVDARACSSCTLAVLSARTQVIRRNARVSYRNLNGLQINRMVLFGKRGVMDMFVWPKKIVGNESLIGCKIM